VRRCPSAGHLLVAVVIRFAFDSAVQLEHGVDSNFPDSLGDGSLFGADNDFALVFVAAQLARDGNMSTFGESGEVSAINRLIRGGGK